MIGKLLGHTKVQTTARYAHLANDSVKGRRKPHRQQNRRSGGVVCLPRNFRWCGMAAGRRGGRVGGVVTRSIPH